MAPMTNRLTMSTAGSTSSKEMGVHLFFEVKKSTEITLPTLIVGPPGKGLVPMTSGSGLMPAVVRRSFGARMCAVHRLRASEGDLYCGALHHGE